VVRHYDRRGGDHVFEQNLWALLQDNPDVLQTLLMVFSGTK
jgi:hypothetical protein